MKKLLTGRKGVTVLEGVIALGLLALVAGGAFGVLLSSSRQSSQPDMREEMVLAVERANGLLKMYNNEDVALNPAGLKGEFCQESATSARLGTGDNNLDCLLPPICDRNNNSHFTYKVGESGGSSFSNVYPEDRETTPDALTGFMEPRRIEFDIVCNGYKL